jgi:hypothetical protein
VDWKMSCKTMAQDEYCKNYEKDPRGSRAGNHLGNVS